LLHIFLWVASYDKLVCFFGSLLINKYDDDDDDDDGDDTVDGKSYPFTSIDPTVHVCVIFYQYSK